VPPQARRRDPPRWSTTRATSASRAATLARKRALFRRVADNLAALGLRREDAWINLVEVPKENGSFAHVENAGEASYAAAEKAPA